MKRLFPVLVLALACGGGQTRIASLFTTSGDGEAAFAKLEERLRRARIPDGVGLAVALTEDGLVGLPLDGSPRWSFKHAVVGRPDIVADVVVFSGAGEVVCLSARTGAVLWRRTTGGLAQVGAGDDGATTVVSFEGLGGDGSLLLAVDRSGAVLRQLETHERIGRPAIVANVAFFPWQGQYVTAYDITGGDVRGRARFRTETHQAFTLGRSLYFGDTSLVRFDGKIGGEHSTASLPPWDVLGASTRWLLSNSDRQRPTAGFADRVRAFARPTPRREPMGIADGHYYASYIRIVFGLDTSVATRWVHSHDSDVLGGSAFRGGLALCDAAGTVTLLDGDSGAVTEVLSFGVVPRACVVQADAVTRAPASTPTPPLADQMVAAVWASTNETAAAAQFLLRELVKTDDPSVTKSLIDLLREKHTAPALLPSIRELLATRLTGAEHMLKELARIPDHLRDVTEMPPVGPLADALGKMGERRAAPLLVRALNHPATPSLDVRRAAAALLLLASEPEQDALESFFALYRCAVEDADMVAAVVLVAQTLLRIGGKRGRETVAWAARDPLTFPGVRDGIVALSTPRP